MYPAAQTQKIVREISEKNLEKRAEIINLAVLRQYITRVFSLYYLHKLLKISLFSGMVSGYFSTE
jgi:hypothetical protein